MNHPADRDGEDEQPDDRRASSLDVTAEALEELSSRAVALAVDYFARISELPVFPQKSASEIAESLRVEFPSEGVSAAQLLDDCRAIFDGCRHNGHPRFFGYIASPSTPVGAFASLLASTLNANVTSWRSSPAATEIEKTTVRWLSQMIGYGDDVGGLLTSGGSMANLNALFTAHRSHASARDASQKGLWNVAAPATLYVSEQVHLSIPKAADVLGLGREQVRVVETDECYRMDVRLLREMIAGDRARGFVPFCIVGSAGTVSTGAVDPLAEIARVAEEHALWFHIDGAYGALAALDASRRHLFAGIERADSVSLDPHKWLYTPVDCGCLLQREPSRARAAFSGTAEDYIKTYEATDDESFAFWDYGIELSRPFRALKVWMMLRYYGVRRIGASIAEDNALADYLAECVAASDDFQLLSPATLGICCFRYLPPTLAHAWEAARDDEEERRRINTEIDELNARIMRAVQRGGHAYLSNATLRGRFALRISITNFRTTRRDIRSTLDDVRRIAEFGLRNADSKQGKD
ncbi:MAG TPA: pyridoxal-dependent decarboxylase [Pyrinomonadaceae bacterium]|jgi:glutamate/tyrosine decarboxylase-like PLP-dependent enzyme